MIKIFFSILCFATFCTLHAAVKLPAFFSDGMVLQRDQKVGIWGKADAGEKISVSLSGQTWQVTADKEGNWQIQLPPQQAGGPYQLSVNELKLNDVYFGDVWLCSGQSNMELPISRVLDMFREEVKDYENPLIRYIKVPLTYNFHSPQDDIPPVEWKPLTKENVMSYAALSYFFAKDLYEKTGVPVGIINSSVGGSPVEAWISREGLSGYPALLSEADMYKNDHYIADMRKAERERSILWNSILYKNDPGLHDTKPWYHPGYDDGGWQQTTLFADSWKTDGLHPVNGSMWFRKNVTIPSSLVGKEAVLRLGCIIDADSVFVNGQLVGTIAYQYPPRIYPVPSGLLQEGENNVTIRLISYEGSPGFVEDKPYKFVFEDGEVNLEGEWRFKRGAAMPSLPGVTFLQYKPTGLYQAMIAPFKAYGISGMIWYQGESNTERYNQYEDLLTELIAGWRKQWNNPDMPFFIIQLPNFMPPVDEPAESQWAELREAQRKVSRAVPHTGLVVAIDAGEWNDIHPLDKKTIGGRLALQVWNKVYGKPVVADGPVYKSIEKEGNKLILSFEAGTNQLQVPPEGLNGFAIATSDREFKIAKAQIENNKVIVWNDGIADPVMVRYAWADNPGKANLRNTSGLPASPFQAEY